MDRDWQKSIIQAIYQGTIPRRLFLFYVGLWITVTSRSPVGTNVFERDWDLLIILDTCRTDALREVCDEYDFISDIGSIISVGSTSNEWMANTFTESYKSTISKTGYISANGYTERVIEQRKYPEVHMDGKHVPPHRAEFNTVHSDDFGLLDQPWQYAPNDSLGHLSPNYVTDRAVSIGREYELSRLIVHYSQPHAPYTAKAIKENRDLHRHEKRPFEALRAGVDFNTIWESYLDNLRMVLNEVEILLQNLEAEKVVLSADHGEAFGEWGMYGHLPGMIHPHVKRVPWVETTGTDSGEYETTFNAEGSSTRAVEEHLQALGYQ